VVDVCCLYGEINSTGAPSCALISQEVLEQGGARECFSSPASCKRKACRSMRAQGNRVGCAEVES
ncbi:hypothetical protein M405DRAFT_811684, partial [Rhizopogon salebrosus TDB-379]